MMDFRPFIFTLLLPFAMLAGACSSDVDDSTASIGQGISTKVLNTPEGSCEGALLLYLDDTSCVRSDASFEGMAMERLFPSIPGKEEIERRHHLDRWYIVRFAQSDDIQSRAMAFAADAKVRRVEYDKKLSLDEGSPIVPLTDDFSGGLDPAPQSKVSDGFNDTYYSQGLQWYLKNTGNTNLLGKNAVEGADVNVKDVWKLSAGDPSIVVAIVDEGVKYTHPDLADNMWSNTKEAYGTAGVDDDGNGYIDDIHGYNFYSDGPITWSKSGDEGHATHVAGLVAAVNNNGIGISSIAGGTGKNDGVKMMSLQIYDSGKEASVALYAKAIKYAADNGACILQCSFGYDSGDYKTDSEYEAGLALEKDALDYFMDPDNANCPQLKQNLVVFSSGNDVASIASYPGAYYKYICVSAFSQDFKPAWYTNYGPGVNISAPGGDSTVGMTILSTVPSEVTSTGSDYGYMQGTSMACPLVSAIAAVGLSYAKKLGKTFTKDEYTAMIETSVDDLDRYCTGTKTYLTGSINLPDYKGRMGTGAIDAWKLMMQIEGTPWKAVQCGTRTSIDLSEYFGGSAANLTYLGVEMDDAYKTSLGLTADPVIENGSLVLTCTKTGCGKVVLRAVAGGTSLGGGDKIGGTEVEKTISIISRGVASENGGWL